MEKEVLLVEWDKTTDVLIHQVKQFAADFFNLIPDDKSWSAAQVAEHLLLVDIGTYKAVSGSTMATNRPPGEKIQLIREVMQSEVKRVAPEVVMPASKAWKPTVIAQLLEEQRGKIREAITTLPLSDACISYKHQALGTLTRLEWVVFNMAHVERHIRQLRAVGES